MKIQIVDQNPTYLKITLEVTKEDIAPSYTAQISKFAKTAQIKGFRQGKAPEGLIRKMAGKDIFIESFSKTIEEQIDNYIKEEEIVLLLPVLLKPLDSNQALSSSFETFENISYSIEMLPINKSENLDWQNCILEFDNSPVDNQEFQLLKSNLEEQATNQSEIEQDFKGEAGLVAIDIVHPTTSETVTFSMPYKHLSPEFDLFLNEYKTGDTISYKVGDMLADHSKIKFSTDGYLPEMDEIDSLTIAGFFNKQRTEFSLEQIYNQISTLVDMPKINIESETSQEDFEKSINSFLQILKFSFNYNSKNEQQVLEIGNSLGIFIDQDILKQTLQSQFKDSDMNEEEWTKVLSYWTNLYIYHIVGDDKALEKQANTNSNYTSVLVLNYTIEKYLSFKTSPDGPAFGFTDLLKDFTLFQMVVNMSYRELSGDRKKASNILANQDTKLSFWETILEKAQITMQTV